MWFEILPSFGIVVAALGVPHAIGYVMNKVAIDNMYRRSVLTYDLRRQYMRDRRLTGDVYVVNGLEAIPDE